MVSIQLQKAKVKREFNLNYVFLYNQGTLIRLKSTKDLAYKYVGYELINLIV